MIPYEYKTYKLMVLPHSSWVDTGDDDDDDDYYYYIIVSVEQRPGWTEHVKVAFLKGPICIHMFVGQPVQLVVSFLSCQTRRPLSQPARLSSLLRTPQRGGSRERKCRFRQIFRGFFDSEKTCKNLQKPINFGEKPRVLSNFSLKLLTKWRIDNDCIYPLVILT